MPKISIFYYKLPRLFCKFLHIILMINITQKYILIVTEGEFMNNLEVIKILNKMVINTKYIKRKSRSISIKTL